MHFKALTIKNVTAWKKIYRTVVLQHSKEYALKKNWMSTCETVKSSLRELFQCNVQLGLNGLFLLLFFNKVCVLWRKNKTKTCFILLVWFQIVCQIGSSTKPSSNIYECLTTKKKKERNEKMVEQFEKHLRWQSTNKSFPVKLVPD